MERKIEQLTEKDYKEFFEWLLGKECELYKEIDLILCSTSINPYVYFPKEINELLKTETMQRLKKVTQLGTGILESSTVYHTRYVHSLGTYNNAVIFYMLQSQNTRWKTKVEAEDKKIEVLADIIESLMHDVGHNILSHGLENLIGKEEGSHELLGERFKEEHIQTIDGTCYH